VLEQMSEVAAMVRIVFRTDVMNMKAEVVNRLTEDVGGHNNAILNAS